MSDVITVKKKDYELSDELKNLAQDVIAAKGMDLSMARIKYVKVYPNINNKTAGRCHRANSLLKLFGDVDYVIEMSGELWDQLDEDRRKILMWHELLHVMPVYNDKAGDWDFKLRQHNVEDFYVILKEHGVDWIHDIKTIFSSIHDQDKLDNLNL